MVDLLNDSVSGGSLESIDGGDKEPLVGTRVTETAVYTRRWYLLLLFSLCCMLWTLIWATWGPIAQSAEAAFSWDDSNIALFLWVGNVPFAALCIPYSWLMDHRGLRVSMLLACFVMAAGAGLRCIGLYYFSNWQWLVYAGQFLNGIAGPFTQGGCALFSNLWFPPGQRATATAISTLIGYMGSSLAFILGPLIIPVSASDADISTTTTTANPGGNLTQHLIMDPQSANNTDLQDGIIRYMYYQAGAAGLLLVLVLIYFPDKPPQPPSLSAATEREEFRPGLAKLIRNKQFWMISLAYSLPVGIFEVWDIGLDVNLNAINIDQTEAGWIGFYSVIAGCGTGLIISRFADIFFRQLKLFLVLFYIVSAVFILWFIFIYIGFLPTDDVSIKAAIILSGVFLDGCSPLFYELVCEAAYPVGEGVSSCFLQMMTIIAGVVFLSIQEIPNLGTTWMNWCLFGSVCGAVPLLLLAKERFARSDIDAKEIIVHEPPENPSMQRDHAHQIHDSDTTTAVEV